MIKSTSFIVIISISLTLLACNRNQLPEVTPASLPADNNTRRNVFLFVYTSLDDFNTYDTFYIDLQGNITTFSDSVLWDGQISKNRQLLLNTSKDIRDSSKEMALLDIDSQEEKRFELANEPSLVSLSPDGKIVAYFSSDENSDKSQLHLYFVEEQEDISLQILDFYGPIFKWSQDGGKLFFLSKSEQTGQYDIYFLNREDFTIHQFTNDTDIEFLLVESPVEDLFLIGSIPISDEYYLLHYPTHTSPDNYYLTDSNAAFKKSFDQPLWEASLSPDGTQIALLDEEGLCLLQVQSSASYCPFPEALPRKDYTIISLFPAAWSEDSQYIAFQALEPETQCAFIFIADLQTNNFISPEMQTCGYTHLHGITIKS